MSSQSSQESQKNVVIVAGEASGDAHAARLVDELKKIDNSICFRGMGGDNLRNAGVDVFIDMAEIAVVGFVEVLMKYNLIKAELNKLKENIEKNPPDLLILVDYQEFNQRLAAFAKGIGVKVLFYIGPQVWAWRPKRVYKMGKIVDHMAVIMPFEKVLYDDANVPVTFTGHPLTDEVVRDKTCQQAREKLQIKDKVTVGLFPGSRGGEISNILPILLESAKLIRQQLAKDSRAEVQFILPVANTIKADDLAPFTAVCVGRAVRHYCQRSVLRCCSILRCHPDCIWHCHPGDRLAGNTHGDRIQNFSDHLFYRQESGQPETHRPGQHHPRQRDRQRIFTG